MKILHPVRAESCFSTPKPSSRSLSPLFWQSLNVSIKPPEEQILIRPTLPSIVTLSFLFVVLTSNSRMKTYVAERGMKECCNSLLFQSISTIIGEISTRRCSVGTKSHDYNTSNTEGKYSHLLLTHIRDHSIFSSVCLTGMPKQ